MRNDIKEAVKSLDCRSGLILHGSYVSSVMETCDAENILFYNVDNTAASFVRSTRLGIEFERSFSQPPSAPSPFGGSASHYLQYKMTSGGPGNFSYWKHGKVLASFEEVRCEPFSRLSPADIWYSMKTGGGLNPLVFRHSSYFGLQIALSKPNPHIPVNLAGEVKPIFDGVISALHQHDGNDGDEVSRRISSRLGKEPRELLELLNEPSTNVLGTRRLVWRRATYVQWNPADERCVAGELVLDEDSTSEHTISGRLFEVEERTTGGVSSAARQSY